MRKTSRAASLAVLADVQGSRVKINFDNYAAPADERKKDDALMFYLSTLITELGDAVSAASDVACLGVNTGG